MFGKYSNMRRIIIGWRRKASAELLPMLLFALLLGAFLSACGDDEDVSTRAGNLPAAFSGIKTNVPESSILSHGWSNCFSGDYGTVYSIATILAGCGGSHLMMACRPAGAGTLALAANAPVADVTFVTPVDNTTVHNANGVSWYFNTSQSWGFSAQHDPVWKSACDFDTGNPTPPSNPELKLCWNAGSGNIDSGWRCGSDSSLFDASWERMVYTGNF